MYTQRAVRDVSGACKRPAPFTSTLKPLWQRSRRPLTTVCAIKARWCIDIKYGVKMEAIQLVQDWVQSIGNIAGLKPEKTSLNSGAVGAPESRIELEVEFDSLAEVEEFWAAIPAAEHQAWSQRARNYIIDGTPRWELYRSCPLQPPASSQSSDAASALLDAWKMPAAEPLAGRDRSLEKTQRQIKAAKEEQDNGKKQAGLTDLSEFSDDQWPGREALEKAQREGKKIVKDWKGDPMIINPGDNMPLF